MFATNLSSCNVCRFPGRLLSKAEYAEANYTIYPTWMVNSSTQLHNSLRDASNKTASTLLVRNMVWALIT